MYDNNDSNSFGSGSSHSTESIMARQSALSDAETAAHRGDTLFHSNNADVLRHYNETSREIEKEKHNNSMALVTNLIMARTAAGCLDPSSYMSTLTDPNGGWGLGWVSKLFKPRPKTVRAFERLGSRVRQNKVKKISGDMAKAALVATGFTGAGGFTLGLLATGLGNAPSPSVLFAIPTTLCLCLLANGFSTVARIARMSNKFVAAGVAAIALPAGLVAASMFGEPGFERSVLRPAPLDLKYSVALTAAKIGLTSTPVNRITQDYVTEKSREDTTKIKSYIQERTTQASNGEYFPTVFPDTSVTACRSMYSALQEKDCDVRIAADTPLQRLGGWVTIDQKVINLVRTENGDVLLIGEQDKPMQSILKPVPTRAEPTHKQKPRAKTAG